MHSRSIIRVERSMNRINKEVSKEVRRILTTRAMGGVTTAAESEIVLRKGTR